MKIALTGLLLLTLAASTGAQTLYDGESFDDEVPVDWTPFAASLFHDGDDAFDNPNSGSALLDGDGSSRLIALKPPALCYVVEHSDYTILGYVKTIAADAGLDELDLKMTIQRYSDESCVTPDGGVSPTAVLAPTIGEARADWQPFAFSLVPPQSTHSFQIVNVGFRLPLGETIPVGTRVAFDEIIMEVPDGIFADGFESPSE